jgi:hypothetical protein
MMSRITMIGPNMMGMRMIDASEESHRGSSSRNRPTAPTQAIEMAVRQSVLVKGKRMKTSLNFPHRKVK